LMSCSVASIRIWSPSLTYCPHTKRSALLDSATRRTVAGSSTVEREMRRSVNIWLTRLGLTVRSCADCPTSVVNISATLEPSQSKFGSPEALRNGRIAREVNGPCTAELEPAPNLLRINIPPPAKTTVASAATPIHFSGNVADQR